MGKFFTKAKIRHILRELGEHLPYSIFGVTVSLVILGLLNFFVILLKSEGLLPKATRELFHIFHPIHILFSATVTTAMFWKHERRFLKTLIIGLAGSTLICALSDIVFPFVGGFLLKVKMELHVCLFAHPGFIIPSALVGVVFGYLAPVAIEKSTQFFHSIHVLVSSLASLFYLISFGITDWIQFIGGIFIITLVAVMIPCCLSDIVFPLSFLEEDTK